MADASLAELPLQVALALSLASSTTGTDYDYLVKTAQRESSFQTDAKAATSSATGLFQFIEETWIRTIKDEGAQYGLGAYAELIVKTESGRYEIPVPSDRERILALRKDAHVSAMMAGAYARRNETLLASTIGREPTSGELYIAHFLGAQDAVRLIVIRDRQQALSAPDLFPKAANANRSIFYRDGKPRSVGEVYNLLIARHERTRTVAPTATIVSGGPVVGDWEATMPTIYSKSELFPLLGNYSFQPSRRSGDAPAEVRTATFEPSPDAWSAEIAVIDSQRSGKAAKAAPAVARTLAKPVIAQAALKSDVTTASALFGLRGSVEEQSLATATQADMPKSPLKTIRVAKN